MNLLFILFAAQLSAVMFAESHQNAWDISSVASLTSLVSTSGYLIFRMLNYKR